MPVTVCICMCVCVALSPHQGRLWVCGAEPSRERAPHGVKWQPPGPHWLMTVKTLAVNVKWATGCHSEAPCLCAAQTTAQQAPLQLDSAVLQQTTKWQPYNSQQQPLQTSKVHSEEGEEQNTTTTICHRLWEPMLFLYLNSGGQDRKMKVVWVQERIPKLVPKVPAKVR